MTYNSNGNLIKMVFLQENVGEEDNEKYNEFWKTTYNFIWENGNLTHVKIIDQDNWDGYLETLYYDFIFKYGTKKNQFQQMPYNLFFIIDKSFEWDYAGCVFASVGLLGKGPVNLPISYYDEDGEFFSIEYKLNPNGSIAEDDGFEYIYGNPFTKSYLPTPNKIRSKELKQKISRREKRKLELRNRRMK